MKFKVSLKWYCKRVNSDWTLIVSEILLNCYAPSCKMSAYALQQSIHERITDKVKLPRDVKGLALRRAILRDRIGTFKFLIKERHFVVKKGTHEKK